ncbi:MAG: hypothetical protein AB7Q23_01110 [Hyphomonadaceae bacterium]
MSRFWGWAAVLLLVAVLSGCLYMGSLMGLAFSVCQANGEIPAAEREAIGDEARAFVQLIRDGETEAALRSMSTEGRAAAQRIAMLNLTEATLQRPPAALDLRDVFKLTSIGSERGMAPCPDESGTAFLARGGGLQSMFVTLAEPVPGGEHTWTFWFEREQGAWRVRGVHLGLSALGDRDGARLWALATEQRNKGNVFNSTALYDLANLTFNRGAFLQAAEANGFASERQLYRRHPDITESRFRVSGRVFPVAIMNATALADGRFILVLEQRADEPVAITEAEARNRALIDGINAERAEWREVFDGLSVAYPTGPNRVWRTLYLRESGYATPAEAPQN